MEDLYRAWHIESERERERERDQIPSKKKLYSSFYYFGTFSATSSLFTSFSSLCSYPLSADPPPYSSSSSFLECEFQDFI